MTCNIESEMDLLRDVGMDLHVAGRARWCQEGGEESEKSCCLEF